MRIERGYGGGYTAIKDLVAEIKAVKREVFVPLIHRPGEAQVRSLDELNARLEERSRDDLGRRLRGQTRSKEELLKEELVVMRELPAADFESSRVQATRASNLSLVRFDSNDYSVPVSSAHREVVAKGDTESVRIYRDGEQVAIHRRIWEREQVRFDPVHYLELLERKPGALDHARPLGDWKLPECLHLLRRRLEANHGSEGTREFIGVLRLLEKHRLKRLKGAVEIALELGCPRKELIEQHLYGEEREDAVFQLDGRAHLKVVKVDCTDPGDYRSLLVGDSGEEEVA